MDRISLRRIDTNQVRSDSESNKRINDLNKLIEISGGIYFGNNIDEQIKILNSNEDQLKQNLSTLRFRAKSQIYKFLREGLQRYPSNQIRISKPDPNENWRPPENAINNFSLKRLENDDFPFPIEIDIPFWTLDADIDFKRWILGFRDGIKVESPEVFLDEIKKTYKDLNELYN